MGLFDPPKPPPPPSYGSKPHKRDFRLENELCGDGTALKVMVDFVVVPAGTEWKDEDSHYAEREIVQQAFVDVLRKTPLLKLLAEVEAFGRSVILTANGRMKEGKVQSITITSLGLYAPSPVRHYYGGGSSGGGDMATGLLLGGASGFALGMALGDN